MLTLHVQIPQAAIADFCRRHHIRKLALFGSALRDDFRLDSDADVLVAFEEGQPPGHAFAGLECELSAPIRRKVDSPTIRDFDAASRARVETIRSAQYVTE